MEFKPLLPSKCQHSLSSLPNELILNIFETLPTFDQFNFALTCKTHLQVFKQNQKRLLQKLFIERRPLSAQNIETLHQLTKSHKQEINHVGVKSLYLRNVGISRSTYERDLSILMILFESTLEKIDFDTIYPAGSFKGFTPKYKLPEELNVFPETRYLDFEDEHEDEELDSQDEDSESTGNYRRTFSGINERKCMIGNAVFNAILSNHKKHPKCKNLTHISLPLAKLSTQRIEKFGKTLKLNNLTHLDFSYTSDIYDECLSILFRQNPGLLVLKMRSCTGINGDCLFYLANHCKILRELDLGYRKNFE